MSNDFYPVPELDGSPPPARVDYPRGRAPWPARFGLIAGALALAFGIGAFGTGQLTAAEQERGSSTPTTQGSSQDAAPAQQPGTAVQAPAAEHDDED